MSSLNPIFTIGRQIAEAIRAHQNKSRHDALARALEMLYLLGIPNPEECLTCYPHQISGGMIQRVMIAMAISCHPTLLVATTDESDDWPRCDDPGTDHRAPSRVTATARHVHPVHYP